MSDPRRTTPAAPPAVSIHNWLLERALGPPDRRPQLDLQVVSLTGNEVIGSEGDPITHVLFPFDCLLSITQGPPTDRAVEVASVGREGLGGLWAAFGLSRWPGGCVTRIPGRAGRMPVDQFRAVLSTQPGFAGVLRAYAASFLRQVGQSTVCLARHSIEEQCARWLALAHDRVGSADLHIGHDALAEALGARRASVTVTLGMLARVRAIATHRLRVSIIDRNVLVQRACACYRAIVDAIEMVHPAWLSTREPPMKPFAAGVTAGLSGSDDGPPGPTRAAGSPRRTDTGLVETRPQSAMEHRISARKPAG